MTAASINRARERCQRFAEQPFHDAADVSALVAWHLELLDAIQPLLTRAAASRQVLEECRDLVRQSQQATEALQASINRISVN